MKSLILVAGLVLGAIQANAAEAPAGTSTVSLKEVQSSEWNSAQEAAAVQSDLVVIGNKIEIAQSQAQVAQALRLASGNSVSNFGALQDVYEFQQVALEKQQEDSRARLNIERKLESEDLRTKF